MAKIISMFVLFNHNQSTKNRMEILRETHFHRLIRSNDMKTITIILTFFLTYSCSTKPREVKSLNKDKIEMETLDNNSELLNNIIDLSDSLSGFIQCAAHMEYCDSCLGIAVFKKIKDSSLVLVLLESVGGMKSKIIGTKQLQNIPSKHEFQSLCENKCKCDFPVLAEIIADNLSQTKTIRAWCPDKKTKSLLLVNPDSVDCTEAYNTDYD